MKITEKTVRLAGIAGITLVLATFLYPVHSRLLEIGWFMGLILLWLAALVLLTDRKMLRLLVFLLPFSAAIPFVLPERTINSDVLCAKYVQCLQAYNGTRYIYD